jgi:hypothetical protein
MSRSHQPHRIGHLFRHGDVQPGGQLSGGVGDPASGHSKVIHGWANRKVVDVVRRALLLGATELQGIANRVGRP